MKIKEGDKVKVIAGKDKGKTGKVLQVFSAEQRISIEGINVSYKHMKSRQEGQAGQRVEFPAPIHISNVMLIDPKSGKPTRVGYKKMDDGKKVRIARASKEVIS